MLLLSSFKNKSQKHRCDCHFFMIFHHFSAENSHHSHYTLKKSTFFDKMTTSNGDHEKITELMENHQNLTPIFILTTTNG